MSARKSIALAQNFIVKPSLIRDLLDASSINSSDIVYEIGPGTGMITRELSRRAGKVIAVEKDFSLYRKLQVKFQGTDKVVLHNADFLELTIQDSCYKVFANIPFNATSAIVRKLCYAEYPPDEAYLIMQTEAAEKFAGIPKTSQFSVLAKPWFSFEITRMFRRIDFTPVPGIDVVMLYIRKRIPSLIKQKDVLLYEQFIKQGFNAWKKNLKQNYKTVFSYVQWKRLSCDLHFPFHARPTDLTFRQWLDLFKFYVRSRKV